jgi:hypothetical protein
MEVVPRGDRWEVSGCINGEGVSMRTLKKTKTFCDEKAEQQELAAFVNGCQSKKDVKEAIKKWRQHADPAGTEAKRRRLRESVAPYGPSKVHHIRVTEGVTKEVADEKKKLFRERGFHAAQGLSKEHTALLFELQETGFKIGGANFVHKNKSCHMITICNCDPGKAKKFKSKGTVVFNLQTNLAGFGGAKKMAEYRLAFDDLIEHVKKEAGRDIELGFVQFLRYRDGKEDQLFHQDGVGMTCGAVINLTDAASTQYLDYDQTQWTSLPRAEQKRRMKEYWGKAKDPDLAPRSLGHLKAGAVTLHDTNHIHRAPPLDKGRCVAFVAFETPKNNTSDTAIFNYEDWERAFDAAAV